MISVVIPTYNEAENIGDLLQEINHILSDRETEFIVVDDNSDDGTGKIVEDLKSEIDNLNLIARKGKSGIGSAYKRGFQDVKGDIVVQMDADFSHRPQDIPKLISALENGKDVAIGSRYVEGGDRNDPLLRRINPWIGRLLYVHILKSPVNDFTSGFKAYRGEVARKISKYDLPDGFHFQAASLMKIVEEGKTTQEVPIDFRPRRAGEPKYNTRDLVDNIELFVRLFLEQYEEMIKFGIVGASGALVNMGILYFLTEQLGIYYLLSAVVAVETSIISNFALNEIWTFVEKGKEGVKQIFKRFFKFNSIAVAGMGINVAILGMLTEFAGIYYLFSNLIAIAAVFGWNYLANVRWTWTE
jgi:dolichol-phosphate mannosyltransferase